jgi:hypothetical protein
VSIVCTSTLEMGIDIGCAASRLDVSGALLAAEKVLNSADSQGGYSAKKRF